MSYLEFIYSIQSIIMGLPEYALCGKENLFDENTMSIEDYCEIEKFNKYDTLKKYMLQYELNKGIPLESLTDVLVVDSDVLYDRVYLPAIRGYCEKSNIASNAKAYRGYVAFCLKRSQGVKVNRTVFTQKSTVPPAINILTDVCKKNGLVCLNIEEPIRFIERLLSIVSNAEYACVGRYFYVNHMSVDDISCKLRKSNNYVLNQLDSFNRNVYRALMGL